MPVFRKATIEDSTRIVEINIDSWKETYKNIFPNSFLLSLDEKIDNSIKKCMKNIDEYIVAVDDGVIVGFARFGANKKNYPDNFAEIYSIYLDSNYRFKKIGTGLISYSFELLKSKYEYCIISTINSNSANEFYRKIGGKFDGTCEFMLDNLIYIENIYLFDL